MGRPPLTEDQLGAKVLAYCERYHASPGPEGLPPFPSGKRETRQHREWLTVYRAHQRFRQRCPPATAPPPHASDVPSCPVCAAPLDTDVAVRCATHGSSSISVHPACAELATLAKALGPEALARLGPLLWPPRPRPAPRSSRG